MTLLAPGAISITDGTVSLRKRLLRGLALGRRRSRPRCSAGKSAVSSRPVVTNTRAARGSWTLVIEPDGKERATKWSASAIPVKTRPTSSDRDQIAEQLRSCLQNMAAAGLTITYGGLARLLELSPPNTIHQMTVALERLMEEDAGAGRPFITALVRSEERRVGKEGK